MADNTAETGRALRCVVVTPEQTVLETTATFVVLPLHDGEIGIAPMHSPMMGRLGYGEMRITQNGTVQRYYVDGGFVQVAKDVVSVLTNRALPVEKIDVAAANSLLESALASRASTLAEVEIRQRQLAQARAQLRMAGKLSTSGSAAHH